MYKMIVHCMIVFHWVIVPVGVQSVFELIHTLGINYPFWYGFQTAFAYSNLGLTSPLNNNLWYLFGLLHQNLFKRFILQSRTISISSTKTSTVLERPDSTMLLIGLLRTCLGILVLFALSPHHAYGVSAANDNNGAITIVEDQQSDMEENKSSEEDAHVEVEDESDDDYDPNADVFYPTKEWQKIEKGQAIPRGLHVRVDMQTGEKEAKLMEGDDGLKYWKKGEKQGMINTKDKKFSHDELKKALKEFKANRDDVKDDKIKEAAIKNKFKSYEELRKDLDAMNINVQTDNEIIEELVRRYNNSEVSTKEKIEILTDLEYHLHQIDNAQVFSDMGGLRLLIASVNHTDVELQTHAAVTLGAAVQSNPQVQIQAIKEGALQQLIRVFSTSKPETLYTRIIFAISSLIRHFPFAQGKFLELGGLDALMELFRNVKFTKAQVKVVTLLNDLLTEQKHSIESAESSAKRGQYEMIPLLETLTERGWCSMIPSLLSLPEHDTREKVLHAMLTLSDSCHSDFKMADSSLQQLRSEYEKLSHEELTHSSDDQYFTSMLHAVNDISSKIQMEKDEL
ncbi:unnamed protein product [Owenia fusiformis]|uniref:Nucleotide exchange factor SIL1 n=1 Tax=Owenia fusiformis TaxID=6347 RepID=A0A8J1UST7_OWEFU|nr:unnamed protein product [Owenia fusiformis]